MSPTLPTGAILSVVMTVIKRVGSPVLRVVLGPKQERAVKAAYKRAVGRSFEHLPIPLVYHLRSGMKAAPVRAEMVKIMGTSALDVDHQVIERELQRKGMAVGDLQIPIEVLVGEVHDRFIQELKGDLETQATLTGAHMEEILGLLADGRSTKIPAVTLARAAERIRRMADQKLRWYRDEHDLQGTGERRRLRVGKERGDGDAAGANQRRTDDRIRDVSYLVSPDAAGTSWVLKAPAGEGKSTILLQLAEILLGRGTAPVLLDLADWPAGDQDLLDYACDEYKASRPELESLAEAGRLFWLLDGWNEVATGHLRSASGALRRFVRSHRSAGVVVSTRLHEGDPPLGVADTAVPLPLTPRERRRIVDRSDLADPQDFLEAVEASPELDELTRTPLFLTAALEIARGGLPVPDDTYSLLTGFVERAEQGSHSEALADQCRGQHRQYLAALASALLVRGSTRMLHQDALTVIGETTTRLRDRGLFGDSPDAAAVLRTLVDHHLLGAGLGARQSIGFVHQRFQEWFGAEYLHELVRANGMDPQSFPADICNRAAWEESLLLLVDRWRQEGQNDRSAQLVGMALTVDPALAMRFLSRLSTDVWEQVRTDVTSLIARFCESDTAVVAEYGASLMVLSQRPTFSENVWRALNSIDDEVRLDMYDRLARFGIGALGDDWPGRALSLPGGAAAFIFGLGGGADPHLTRELVRPFQTEQDLLVRSAAIQALIWAGYGDEAVSWMLDSEPEILLQDAVRQDLDLLSEEHLDQLREWLTAAVEYLGPGAPLILRVLMASLSDDGALQSIKEELAAHPFGRPPRPALELLKERDPAWLSEWIALNLPASQAWSPEWENYLRHDAEGAAERLVRRCIEDGAARGASSRLVTLAERLAPEPTAVMLGDAFAQRWNDGAHPLRHNEETALDQALRDVSVATSIRAILESGIQPQTPDELLLILRSLPGGWSREKEDPGVDLRRQLRSAAGTWLQMLERAGERVAGFRVQVAGVIGECGEADDADELMRLIELDRNDARREQEETGRRHKSPYQMLYTRALTSLRSASAEKVLTRLLADPEYFGVAAQALAEIPQLAVGQGPFTPPFWKRALQARDAAHPISKPSPVSLRVEEAFTTHLDMRGDEPGAEPFAHDIGIALTALARLHAPTALALVPRILPLEGSEFGLTNTLEVALAQGAEVPGETAEQVFEKLLAHLDRYGPALQDQEINALINGLGLMLLSTSPGVGVRRCVELRPRLERSYHFGRLFEILGSCADPDTFAYLSELAEDDTLHERWRGAAIAAITSHRFAPAGRWVLDHIGSVADTLDTVRDGDGIARRLRERASREPDFWDGLVDTARTRPEGPVRALLFAVLRDVDGQQAAVLAAYLLDDREEPPSLWLLQHFEKAFFQRESVGSGGAYTLVPRSDNELRRLLFGFILSAGGRRVSAACVLVDLESKRLELGRPVDEPRHPNLGRRLDEPWQLQAIG